jgi:radical SAM-linked protein
MKLTKEEIKSLPPLETPRDVRIKFKKVGKLQYISHLDLQRTLMRVIARSGIPVWYTKGFNPHAKLVFAAPIAVGVQSVCEYLDIRVDRDISCAEITELLNAELTNELCVIESYLPETGFADIVSADYSFEIKTDGASSEKAADISRILTTSPLNVIKKTKSGDKEIDIVPKIMKLSVFYSESEDTVKMTVRLPAGNTESLNPDFLIDALREKAVILVGDPTREWYTIIRTGLNDTNGQEFR